MTLDKPSAGTMVIVHGGERRSKSTSKTRDGTAWKLRSSLHQSWPMSHNAHILTSMERKDGP